MSRKKIKIVSVILCVCLLGGALYQSGIFKAGNIGTFTPAGLSPKNPDEELGSAENPFTVLEIVPNHEMAQFGYFIPGCEPIDMDLASYDNTVISKLNNVTGLYEKNGPDPWSPLPTTDEYAFYDQIPASTKAKVYATDNRYKSRSDLTYTNTYPNNNLGAWINNGISVNHSQRGDWVAAPNGGFKLDNGTYTYVGEGSGSYRWVPSESGSAVRTANNNDVFKLTHYVLNHKDEFIKAAFPGETSQTFQSQVVVLTPEELESCTYLIETADLIYIHGVSGDYAGIAYAYNKLVGDPDRAQILENNQNSVSKDSFLNGGKFDLTYTETMMILERMASQDPAALIMDMTKMMGDTDQQRELNCHKLIYMVLMYRPEFFQTTFGPYLKSYEGWDHYQKVMYSAPDKNDPNATVDYKSWWTHNTPFMVSPGGADLSTAVRYENINPGGWNIFDKIFTFQGDKSLLQELMTGGNISNVDKTMNDGKNVTSDAFVDDNENKPSLTFLDAVKFILGKASYTPKLRVLEIEGCDEFIYGSSGWEEYYQKLFPWYKPKTTEDNWLKDKSLIEVTTMPTWEFIGSVGRYDYGELDQFGNRVLLTADSSDDLTAKYDLILIGSKQNAANGAGGYNEYTNPKAGNSVNLGNLIYTSIGGTYSDGEISEMNEAKYSEQLDMRHAGNDITLKKLLELEDFLKAGKPIVIDSGLYSGSSVDTSKVDQDSKLYDLLTWTDSSGYEGHKNRFVYDAIDSAAMKKLVKNNVCRLVFEREGYPGEYDYIADPSNGAITTEIYTGTTDGNGNRTLDFEFYIEGSTKYDYALDLYLDLNGDGVYAGSEKEAWELTNMNRVLGESNTAEGTERAARLDVYRGSYDPDDKLAAGTALAAKKVYLARYVLPPSVQGIVPWKLEVRCVEKTDADGKRVGSKHLRSSAVDYTLVRGNNGKEPITVLQMNLWPDMSQDTSVTKSRYNQDNIFTAFTRDAIVVKPGETYSAYAQRNAEGDPEVEQDRLYGQMSADQRMTILKFETYIKPVEEFDVKIRYLFNSDWYQLFGTEKTSGDEYDKALNDWRDFLADYDMLVFGFVDGSVFTSNTVFAEGVKEFIAQGKSMILSHDTMYGSNGTDVYGEYNSWLRTVSGQRRSYYNKQAEDSYVKSFNDVKANGSQITFVSDENTKDDETDADGNVTVNEYRKYFDKLQAGVDGDTVESKFYDTWVNEWPDNETYLQICAQGTGGLSLGSTERVTKNGSINSYVWAHPYSRETTFVKLTNNGQITTYPYRLNDVIEVLSTHTQYYQLDMEPLKGGDVNVWFTLSDIYDPEVEAYAKELHKAEGENAYRNYANFDVNIYSAKDMDCRNSFYIYNKGNITYTGSGHGEAYGYGQSNALMTNDEVMLFVNTMISAYRQPETRPSVKINNADAMISDGTAVLYLDHEEGSAAAPAQSMLGTGNTTEGLDGRVEKLDGRDMVRIEFVVSDRGSESEVTKKYYIKLMEDGVLMNSSDVRVFRLDANGNRGSEVGAGSDLAGNPRYNLGKNKDDETAWVNGIRYAMYVPYEHFKARGEVRYTVGTYAEYTKSSKNVTTATSNANALLMRLPLFDLN